MSSRTMRSALILLSHTDTPSGSNVKCLPSYQRDGVASSGTLAKRRATCFILSFMAGMLLYERVAPSPGPWCSAARLTSILSFMAGVSLGMSGVASHGRRAARSDLLALRGASTAGLFDDRTPP